MQLLAQAATGVDAITGLGTAIAPYAAAAFTVAGIVLGIRVGLKWVRGLGSKAS